MELETQAAFDPASFEHIPVLLNECLEGLALLNLLYRTSCMLP